MLLSSGEQIPSDAEVMSGIAEANEAMLTGESDLVLKEVGDELLSGSYIASGQVYARVKRVGANNYANKLMMEAKTLKPINSRILYNLAKISSFTGKIIIPFGLALFFEALLIKMLANQRFCREFFNSSLGNVAKGNRFTDSYVSFDSGY